MALDPRFIVVSDLQSLFVNKNNGEPLAGGIVTFYKDADHSTLKPVYQLTGSPPNYSYSALPNPCILGAAGNFVDEEGNDIVPYYFPYDGDPDDSENTVELYYVTVESSGESPQFVRQAWPNFVRDDTDLEGLLNYVPNGQFLLHNNIPVSDTKEAGEIRAAVTDLAYGGWTFERPGGSSAKDIVTFEPIGTITTPDANPSFALKVVTETPSVGDAYKDVRLKFTDVNKFASNTQQYTFAIAANTNTGSTMELQLILIKNFGSGGSTTLEIPITAFDIQPANSINQVSFTFGTNEDYTVGTDSFIQLALRYPVAAVSDSEFTNAVLTPGAVNITGFPQTPDAKFKYEAIAGFIDTPDYDGKDLYLKPILTKSGLAFDDSVIGDVVAESAIHTYTSGVSTTTNRLMANGGKYERIGYSTLGIPYQRLADKYWIESIKTPRYGTGSGYLTAIFSGTGNELRIDTNDAKAVTDATDTSTTFTISNIAKGGVWYTKAYLISADTFLLQNLNFGAVANAADVDTTFTIFSPYRLGSTLLPEISRITTVAASFLADPGNPGHYFTFESYNAGVQKFYVWYQITNETDPAPALYTGIKINLTGTETAAIVAQKTREALNGWQCTKILTVAASAIPAGAYFNIYSSTTQFYVWYKKDGVGTDPAVVGATGIQVDILAADTNTIVATKTQETINRKYFAVPNYQGMFLRGWDNGANIEPEADTRYSLVPGIIGDELGTSQLDDIYSHTHRTWTDPLSVGTGSSIVADEGDTRATQIDDNEYMGGYESRPVNTNVNYAIIY